ncbi:Phosphatidylcholine translocator ABCB4, partial [Taenia solium]
LKEKNDESDNDDDDAGDDDNIENIIRAAQQDQEKGDRKPDEDSDVEGKTVVSSLSESIDEFILRKKPNTFLEVLRLNAPEKWFIFLGCITSVLIGGTQAAFVIVYTEMYDIFFVNDSQTRLDRTSAICGGLGGLAALRLICYTLNGYAFGVAGGRLTTRCRILLFETILKQCSGDPSSLGTVLGVRDW